MHFGPRSLALIGLAMVACSEGPDEVASPECGEGASPDCYVLGGVCVTPATTARYGHASDASLSQYFAYDGEPRECQARMLVECESGPYVIWAMHGESGYVEELAWVVVLDEQTLEWVGEVEPRFGTQACGTWYRGDLAGRSCAFEGIDRVSDMLPECNVNSRCEHCDCVVNTVNEMRPAECSEDVGARSTSPDGSAD